MRENFILMNVHRKSGKHFYLFSKDDETQYCEFFNLNFKTQYLKEDFVFE